MREIKFEAFHIPTQTMFKSNEIESINFDTKVLCVWTTEAYQKLRLSDFHLRQYTGLKDKNGMEIYDGDIVEQEFLGIAMVDYSEFIGVVKFIDGSYVVENVDGSYGRELFQEIDTNEVIGNIYSNPELLKSVSYLGKEGE